MTISTNMHLLRPVFTIGGYTGIPSPCSPDLSFSRWQRCYKSHGSFPLYLASEVQKWSNAPIPGQKLATKISKSSVIPPYVPRVNPLGWPLISALLLKKLLIFFTITLPGFGLLLFGVCSFWGWWNWPNGEMKPCKVRRFFYFIKKITFYFVACFYSLLF